MDYRLALIAGTDLPIPECQAVLHQPTIKEIAFIGEKEFFTGVQCLCIQKTMCIEDESLLATTTNFQIFMTLMNDKSTVDKKAHVISVLTVLFPGYKVIFMPRTLVLNKDGTNISIDENNFEILQQVLERIFCLRNSDQATFNPGNDAAKKIADKLMRAREKVAKQKAAEGGGNSSSTFGQYVSILTVGLSSMSIHDCLNLTMYQLYDLVERYMLYVNWDIDLRSRLAGGKPDSKPDNWMKIIH